MKELFDIELSELSLVDDPANQHAKVTLCKRAKKEKEDMSETVEKSVFDEVKADLAKLKAENEKLRKSFLDEGYTITAEGVKKKEVEKKVEMITIDGEFFAKSAIPAPMLKAYEEAIAEKADAEFSKRAKKALPNVPEGFAKALVKNFENDAEIMEFVTGLDAMFKAQTEEIGDGNKEDLNKSSNDKMMSFTKAYQENHPEFTYAAAYAAVAKTEQGQKLIADSYKENK